MVTYSSCATILHYFFIFIIYFFFFFVLAMSNTTICCDGASGAVVGAGWQLCSLTMLAVETSPNHSKVPPVPPTHQPTAGLLSFAIFCSSCQWSLLLPQPLPLLHLWNFCSLFDSQPIPNSRSLNQCSTPHKCQLPWLILQFIYSEFYW